MYKAILFSLDGDYVTDFSGTKEEVMDSLNNMGSRWFFYPLVGIVTSGRTTNRSRVVSMGEPLTKLSGKSVGTIRNIIKANSNVLIEMLA